MNEILPSDNQENGVFKQLGVFLLLSALLGSLCFILIVGLRYLSPDLVRSGGDPWVWEVGTGSLALGYLAAAGFFSRYLKNHPALRIPLVCTVLVGLLWLAFIRQTYGAKWDFECYYLAGSHIRQGVNIYHPEELANHRYLYSPALATIFSLAKFLPPERQINCYMLWSMANYWAAMIFMLLLAASLRAYRVTSRYLWPAVAVAMVCNVPLQRTLLYSQVNLHVANFILGFLLLSKRRPALAGVMLALAGILKSSPLVLAAAVVMQRQWRILVGLVVGGIALVSLSVALVGIRPWREFLHALPVMQSKSFYRDNSVESLLTNLWRILGGGGGIPIHEIALVAGLAGTIGMLLLAARSRRRGTFVVPEDGRSIEAVLPFCLGGMMLVSPQIWEHHWVFMQLPFILLVARALGTRLLAPALICYALVFMVPTFDVFLLSYHRLAGLVLWAVLATKLGRLESTQDN